MTSIRIVLLLLMLVSTLLVSTQTQQCKHPFPILMKTASGIDITKFDFFPIGPTNSNWDGFVENVFNFTCNGDKWVDGLLKEPIEYDVPDEYASSGRIMIVPVSSAAEYSIDLSALDVKISRKNRIKFSWPSDDQSIKYLFSQNPKYQSLLKQFTVSGKIFAQATRTVGFITLDPLLTNKGRLSDDFADFISKILPPKYEDNPTIYQQFVQRFGTHYYDSGSYVFSHHIQFAIDQQYALEHTDEQIERNLKLAFYHEFNISDFGGTVIPHWPDTESTQVDEDFARHSEVILLHGRKSSKWVDKLSGKTFLVTQIKNSDRMLYSIALNDMGDLIKNGTIAAQVKIAIRIYLIKAYLGELKNVYSFTNYQLSKEENASLGQVESMLVSNDVLNMDKIDKIIDDLYRNVQMSTVKKFCYPNLRDLYVTANLRYNFAKQICASSPGNIFKGHFSRRCASSDIRQGQEEANQWFSSYERGTLGQDCFKRVRDLNVRYHILKDRDNGLEAICSDC